jgi:Domain of unknown function (DUF4157)
MRAALSHTRQGPAVTLRRGPGNDVTPSYSRRTGRHGLSWNPVQAKLTVGPVDDPLEREADRVADAVVSGQAAPGAIQRKCAECEEDEQRAMRKAAGPVPLAVAALPNLGGGVPLPASVRAAMEPRFGRSFADVRVHTDADAAASATALNARAYVLGSDIAFAPGECRPYVRDGQRLLAHELAHFCQQDARASLVARRQPNMPGPAPSLGQFTLEVDERGRLDVRAAGPQETPVVSSPTIGLRRDREGRFHLLVGGKDKVVSVDEIPRLIRGAIGGQGSGSAKQPRLRVPTCSQLRLWGGAERAPGFKTYDQYVQYRRLWHSQAAPLGGEVWVELSPPFYEALIELCIAQQLELTVPEEEPAELQDAPERTLPPGIEYA